MKDGKRRTKWRRSREKETAQVSFQIKSFQDKTHRHDSVQYSQASSTVMTELRKRREVIGVRMQPMRGVVVSNIGFVLQWK